MDGRLKNILPSINNLLVVFALIIASNQLMGQAISTTKLLESIIINDQNHQPYNQIMAFYNNTKQGLTLVDEINFRTETDEFDLNQQQYQMRFKFNGLTERKITNQIIQLNQSEYKIKQELHLLNRLEHINRRIITWYILQQELKLQKEEFIILQDEHIILQKLIKNGVRNNLKGWISNGSDLRKLELSIFHSQNMIKQINDEFFKGSDASNQVNFDHWISLQHIINTIDKIQSQHKTHPNYRLYQLLESEALAKIDLESAKSKIWFDYIQVQYKGNEKHTLENEFSIGTSINIPFKSLNRIKQNESKVTLLNNQSKAMRQTEKYEYNLRMLIDKFYQNITSYKILNKSIDLQNYVKTYDSYKEISNISPLILIDLKQSIINDSKQQLDFKNRIYHLYLDIIYQTGALTKMPLVNYLDDNNTPLNIPIKE